jgi:hypothetical protein
MNDRLTSGKDNAYSRALIDVFHSSKVRGVSA